MPFSILPNIDEFAIPDDDESPTADAPIVAKPDVRAALARFMLEAHMTHRQGTLRRSPPLVAIIQTPSIQWAELIGDMLRERHHASVQIITERKRQAVSYGQGGDQLDKLNNGHSLIFVTQDPSLLEPSVGAAADEIIVLPRPSPALIRKTIHHATGRFARGLAGTDLAGLDAHDLVAAIRPGSSAHDCVVRLRRASAAKATPRDPKPAPKLESLPLTRAVNAWTTDMLGAMGGVDRGSIASATMRFAVLEGPPGTGKTTIAAGLARSSGWAFVQTSCGAWFSGSDGALGGVAKAAKTFFDSLTAHEGSVVGFIDELDSLPDRARLDSREASWWTPVVNLVLTEIDTIRKSGKPILLIGATNHYQRLDPALVRAGRLERRVPVLLPDEAERKSMFRHYPPRGTTDDELAIAARLAIEATPATIEASVLTARAAAEAAGRPVRLDDLVKALTPADNRSPEMVWSVCLHEAGHAIAALELALPIVDISILSSGSLAGWTRTNLSGLMMTRSDVERIGIVLLAGRAADLITGLGANAGAQGDLAAANRLIADSMFGYGLYDTLQTAETVSRLDRRPDGRSFNRAIGDELDRLMQMSVDLIERRRGDVVRLAEHLRTERVIPGARIALLVDAKATTRKRTRRRPTDEGHRLT